MEPKMCTKKSETTVTYAQNCVLLLFSKNTLKRGGLKLTFVTHKLIY